MLFVWIALWTTAIVLIAVDPHRLSARWAGATAFAGGAGALAATIEEHLSTEVAWSDSVTVTLTISSLLCQLGLPYCYLLFALTSSTYTSTVVVKWATIAGLIPLLAQLYVSPIFPTYTYDFTFSLYWAGPYIAIGSFMLLYEYAKESDPVYKRAQLYSCIVAIIPVVGNFITSNVFRSIGNEEIWQYNVYLIAAQIVLILVFGYKVGVLGIKLRVERARLDSAIRTLSNTTSILNHSLKNELLKLHILFDRLKVIAAPELQRNEQASLRMKQVEQAVSHMQQMVDKIRAQSQQIEIHRRNIPVHSIVNQAIASVEPFADASKVQIKVLSIDESLFVFADEIHLTEVIANVLLNAIEASEPEKLITVNAQARKKHTVLIIQDEGCGIASEHLSTVLDPFYSTKQGSTNFGLGLTYAFNVMSKHGGKLELSSELGVGTTVYLYVPTLKQ